VNAGELLAAIRRTLGEITQLVPESRDAWDENRLLPLAVMKLWIDAGNYAELYRSAIGLPTRVEPWSGLVGYRGILAHQLPEDLNQDRLWFDVHEAPRTLVQVNAAARP
jgi:hypothetical protein